jgi:hypothetical protein
MTPITFELPIKTVNESNGMQGHWQSKAGRRKRHHAAVNYRWPRDVKFAPALVVTLTRLSAGTLDDDGLRAALKAIRDGVASKLKVDDASDLVSWVYAQERCAKGTHSVRVEIRRAP